MKINAVLAYCTLYYVQYSLQLIAAYFAYYKYVNHNKKNVSVYDYVYQAKNY